MRLEGSNCNRRSNRSIAGDSLASGVRGRRMNLPCGEAFGSTCWNGIFGYLGNCLITISGVVERSESMLTAHFNGKTHRISGNLS